MNPSVLIKVRENGAEDRVCGECNEAYLLPIPYEKCNPKSRDLCCDCIAKMQRESEG